MTKENVQKEGIIIEIRFFFPANKKKWGTICYFIIVRPQQLRRLLCFVWDGMDNGRFGKEQLAIWHSKTINKRHRKGRTI